jgi:Raf kinase inhibitor-like YbhB/YbcL family protein
MQKLIIVLVLIAGAAIVLIRLSQYANIPANRSLISDQIKNSSMLITSPSFKNDESIPVKFSCDGGDMNPELQIQNVPAGAKSLALIVDDPDATRGRTFTHWLVWNIDPKTTLIKEESVPPGAVEGTNDFPRVGYGGPCPPHGSKPHHYHLTLYALSAILDLSPGADKAQLETEIEKNLITKTELIGLFQR